MSDILSSAQRFQKKSKEQAAGIEQSFLEDFKKREESIKRALNSSTSTIQNAIKDQTRQTQKIVLRTWLGCAIAVISILLLAQGMIWWQGTQIVENWQTISQQRQQLNQLEQNGSKIQLARCGGTICIVVAKDKPMYERREDKRPMFIPEGY